MKPLKLCRIIKIYYHRIVQPHHFSLKPQIKAVKLENKIRGDTSKVVTELNDSTSLDSTTMLDANSTSETTIQEKRENFLFIVTDEDTFTSNQLSIYIPVIFIVLVIMVSVLCFIKYRLCGKSNKIATESGESNQPSFAVTISGFS